MSLRDENLSAGVMVALFSLVTMLAWLGALFLPPSLTLQDVQWLGELPK